MLEMHVLCFISKYTVYTFNDIDNDTDTLTLFVCHQEEHWAEWWSAGVVMSGVRCRWFAYGAAHATATLSSLAS